MVSGSCRIVQEGMYIDIYKYIYGCIYIYMCMYKIYMYACIIYIYIYMKRSFMSSMPHSIISKPAVFCTKLYLPYLYHTWSFIGSYKKGCLSPSRGYS